MFSYFVGVCIVFCLFRKYRFLGPLVHFLLRNYNFDSYAFLAVQIGTNISESPTKNLAYIFLSKLSKFVMKKNVNNYPGPKS